MATLIFLFPPGVGRKKKKKKPQDEGVIWAGSLYLAGQQFGSGITISLAFFFFFSQGIWFIKPYRNQRGGGRGNLNQLKDRRTYGWLIRPAFTCWLRSTSWIKTPRCQQEEEERGEGRHPELASQGHLLRRRQLRRLTGFTESEFQEVFLHNRLVIARLCKRTRHCGSPDFNPVCWEWLSYPDPFDWLSAGRLPRWPTK